MKFLNRLANKFREPSTWKGLFFLLSLAGYKFSPQIADTLTVVGPQVVEHVSALITCCLGAWEVIRKEPPKEIVNVQQSEPAAESQRIITPELSEEERERINAN